MTTDDGCDGGGWIICRCTGDACACEARGMIECAGCPECERHEPIEAEEEERCYEDELLTMKG